MAKKSYHQRLDLHNKERLRGLIKSLPPFAFEYFRGIEQTTSSRTRIAYAYDLRIFFNYLLSDLDEFKNRSMDKLTTDDLGLITMDHLERYMDHLNYYYKSSNEKDNQKEIIINHERGKSRKIASLRTFFNYFYKKQKIKSNPAALIDMPKIHQRHITRLEIDEVVKLLDEVESGEHLSPQQKRFHEHTKERDLALITLLLGTGLRVSECVGLDIKDIDFSVNGLRIIRKGGNEVVIYFGEEVEEALSLYLEKRRKTIAKSGHEEALFLSLQNRRLSVRSVQNLVKKYSQLVTHLKNISPHKLRSTYGTNLYRETGDIYLVADVLGHKDVNTTKKHYAELDDERRRKAARVVKLRDID